MFRTGAISKNNPVNRIQLNRIQHYGVAAEWDLSVVVTHVPLGQAVRFRTTPFESYVRTAQALQRRLGFVSLFKDFSRQYDVNVGALFRWANRW